MGEFCACACNNGPRVNGEMGSDSSTSIAETQTDTTTNVTLAAHARRGLITSIYLKFEEALIQNYVALEQLRAGFVSTEAVPVVFLVNLEVANVTNFTCEASQHYMNVISVVFLEDFRAQLQ